MGDPWFPSPWRDGSSEAARDASFRRSIGLLDAYLTDSMEEEGVPASATALVGFSQGTMMGLYVAPRRDERFACIVGFSGRLVANDFSGALISAVVRFGGLGAADPRNFMASTKLIAFWI